MSFPLQKILRGVATAAAFALCAAAAQASPVYDNLGASQAGSDPIYSYGPIANSFNTGANGSGWLTGIQALLGNGSGSVVGDITVSLHADGLNAPGAQLVSLGSLSSANVATGSFAAYAFTPVSAVQLAANTTYWIEIEATGANGIFWSWSDDLLALGVAGQSNYSAILGGNANSADFGPYQMAVQVPEPASLALVFMALTMLGLTTLRRKKR